VRASLRSAPFAAAFRFVLEAPDASAAGVKWARADEDFACPSGLRDADRRISSLRATEVRRQYVSNGGSELGALEADRLFLSLQEMELILLQLLALSSS
jgi:hypothetical protein